MAAFGPTSADLRCTLAQAAVLVEWLRVSVASQFLVTLLQVVILGAGSGKKLSPAAAPSLPGAVASFKPLAMDIVRHPLQFCAKLAVVRTVIDFVYKNIFMYVKTIQ